MNRFIQSDPVIYIYQKIDAMGNLFDDFFFLI